jgi:putative PIG3 family NAD(P)H quinone oxidoreductase
MRAVVLRAHGGPEVLTIEDLEDPAPGPEEVLVRVAGSAVNRADVLQRMGHYPDPRGITPEVPGMEFSGTVEALGERCTLWSPGDRVMGITAGGGYAGAIALHERQLLRVPDAVDLVDAAAIPEVFLTAWDALVIQGGLTSGRWALVHAGASGVGTAAIQIVKALGANIAVTCSAGKADACRQLGADAVFERSPADWVSEAKALRPAGFDVVLDVVGGAEINRNLAVVAVKGTIMQVGLMGGGTTSVEVGLLLAKRIRWIGTTLRPRPIEEKVAVTRRFAAEVLPLFDDGTLSPVVDTRYPLDQVAEAHARMESNANTGKLVLTL